jgi:hypothetical protein
MENYISNITKLNKTENNISFTFEGRPYYLTLSLVEQSIKLQLKEVDSLLNYTANIIFSDMKKEKLFSLCEDIFELKEALNKLVSEGKKILQANKDNTYKLTLYSEVISKCFSVEIMLREKEMLNDENILHRINEQLKALPTLMQIEDMIKLHCNSFSESMKAYNNEVSTLREEIKLQFREHSESYLKAYEEKVFKAINNLNNYELQIDSLDSFTNKMSLYKVILMNLEDDKIGKQLKESFCSLSSIVSNEFRNHYQNIKEISTEHKIKEEYLIQTIKELKDEILKQNSRQDNLIQSIREHGDGILGRNAGGNINVSSLEELNKNNNDNYKQLNQVINHLNDNIKTIRMCLEESKQNNNTKLVTETQNLTFSKKMIVDNKNSIEEKLLNKIEENILFSVEKFKTIKTNVIIGEHKEGITSMIALPNDYIATASCDKTVKIWDLNKNIPIKSLEGHTDAIWCLALLPDGNLASGSRKNN